MYRLDPDAGPIERILPRPGDPASLPDAHVTQLVEGPGGSLWVWPAAVIVYLICLAAALASIAVTLRVLRRAQAGEPEGRDSRDCFIGYSGAILAIGSSAVILANLLALIMVPPCAL